MITCECHKCVAIDNKEKEKALELWNNGIRNIEIRSWDWNCADGCCSDYGISLTVNDYLVTNTLDVYNSLETIFNFLGMENVNFIEDDWEE